jgi:glycosyltransferase involved in cell wall biosynthesis
MSAEEAAKMIKEEMALAAHADCVVSVSDSESQSFRKHGVDRVHVLGHVLQTSPTSRPFHERTGFLFAGAMREESSPNVDSIIWFVEEVFPRIQAGLNSEITLTIAGDNKLECVRQLAGPSVRVIGPLPDLTELYDSARVFVAPTRFAAGIPHKVHEAAARGVPVVATPLLASQLGWQDGGACLVGKDAESFAAKCIQLYASEALWTKLREAGLERIRVECSKELFHDQLKTIMKVKQARFTSVGMDR